MEDLGHTPVLRSNDLQFLKDTFNMRLTEIEFENKFSGLFHEDLPAPLPKNVDSFLYPSLNKKNQKRRAPVPPKAKETESVINYKLQNLQELGAILAKSVTLPPNMNYKVEVLVKTQSNPKWPQHTSLTGHSSLVSVFKTRQTTSLKTRKTLRKAIRRKNKSMGDLFSITNSSKLSSDNPPTFCDGGCEPPCARCPIKEENIECPSTNCVEEESKYPQAGSVLEPPPAKSCVSPFEIPFIELGILSSISEQRSPKQEFDSFVKNSPPCNLADVQAKSPCKQSNHTCEKGINTSVVGSPSQAHGSPSRALGSPSRALGSPSQALGSPSRSLGSPSDSQALGSPSRALGSPSRALGSPSRALGSPPRALGSPSRVHGSLSGTQSSHSVVHGSISRTNSSPSGVQGSPSGVHGSPSGVHGSPSGVHGSPSGVHGSPSGTHGSPPRVHCSPSQTHSNPSRAHGSPSSVCDNPAQGHCSSRNIDKSPLQVHSISHLSSTPCHVEDSLSHVPSSQSHGCSSPVHESPSQLDNNPLCVQNSPHRSRGNNTRMCGYPSWLQDSPLEQFIPMQNSPKSVLNSSSKDCEKLTVKPDHWSFTDNLTELDNEEEKPCCTSYYKKKFSCDHIYEEVDESYLNLSGLKTYPPPVPLNSPCISNETLWHSGYLSDDKLHSGKKTAPKKPPRNKNKVSKKGSLESENCSRLEEGNCSWRESLDDLDSEKIEENAVDNTSDIPFDEDEKIIETRKIKTYYFGEKFKPDHSSTRKSIPKQSKKSTRSPVSGYRSPESPSYRSKKPKNKNFRRKFSIPKTFRFSLKTSLGNIRLSGKKFLSKSIRQDPHEKALIAYKSWQQEKSPAIKSPHSIRIPRIVIHVETPEAEDNNGSPEIQVEDKNVDTGENTFKKSSPPSPVPSVLSLINTYEGCDLSIMGSPMDFHTPQSYLDCEDQVECSEVEFLGVTSMKSGFNSTHILSDKEDDDVIFLESVNTQSKNRQPSGAHSQPDLTTLNSGDEEEITFLGASKCSRVQTNRRKTIKDSMLLKENPIYFHSYDDLQIVLNSN